MKQLKSLPRHQEWVNIEYGGRRLSAFVVCPEISSKATSVIVIHMNVGLNDWVRSIADQNAGEGFIANAPDLLSSMSPNGGKTYDYALDTAR